MSTSNLSPLELVVSHNSGASWSESTRHNSQSGSGSDFQSPQSNGLSSRRPWHPAATNFQQNDGGYHYYLGDIYARNKTAGDLVLSTQAEQE
jgi:hypothetical protein